MQVIFAFTFNTGTKEAIFTGNVEPTEALQILQGIVIAEAVKRAKETDKEGAAIKQE